MKKCCLCSDPIPKESREKLSEMGYNGLSVSINGMKVTKVFCPKHHPKEFVEHFMESIGVSKRQGNGQTNHK